MKLSRRLTIGINVAIAVASFYIVALSYLYFMQGSLIFQPDGIDPFEKDHRPFQAFVYQTPLGLKERGLWYPPVNHKPSIIYFHGNNGSIGTRLDRVQKYLHKGYGVVMVEYRGYGGNPGIPSEQNLMEDARAAIEAIQHKNVPLKEMVLYGESLGTGVATQMALEYPSAKALVLEAPYTSIVDVAAIRYWYLPIRPFVKEKFETSKKIAAVKMPVLIMHGMADKTVPYEMGKTLYSMVTSPTKKFASIENGAHNNLYNYHADEIVDEFLQKLH